MNEESSPADRNTVMTDIIQALEQRGYSIDGVACRTGRPDRSAFPVVSATGCRAIAKLYPKNNGQAAFENMQRLWCSDFGAQRKPPRMPKPIEYMPEASILITQRVDGQPLVEFPAIGTDVLRGSIALLVDLHRSDVQPMTHRTAKKLVRSVQRKAARIAEVAPRYTPAISEVLQALERTKVGDTQLVPSHGDFSPRNILVGSSRLVLIDWDRLQWADPARDVAYLGAWCWAASVRRGQAGDWEVLHHAVSAYAEMRPEAQLKRQMGFHIATGLVRIACSLVELWPEEAAVVPRLAAEALSSLA